MPELEYWFEMPRKYTFEMPKVRKFVEKMCYGKGRVLNLFGGIIRLNLGNSICYLHNDIRSELNPDVSVDAYDPDAVGALGKFDVAILDPPYSAFQAVVSYGGCKMQKFSLVREGILRTEATRVITLGWSSTGMSKKRGFEKKYIAVVNHGGSHNDTLITVEDMINGTPNNRK